MRATTTFALLVSFLISTWAAVAQVTQIQAPVKITAAGAIGFTPDGQAVVMAPTANVGATGVLLTATAGGMNLRVYGDPIGDAVNGYSYKTYAQNGNFRLNGFRPQTGIGLLGEMRTVGTGYVDTLYNGSTGHYSCPDYVGRTTHNTWGPYTDSDGTYRFSGVDAEGDYRTVVTTLFTLNPGSCTLTAVKAYPGFHIGQWWSWGDGYLADRFGRGNPGLGFGYIFDEIIYLAKDGSYQTVIGTLANPAAPLKKQVTTCCDLVRDTQPAQDAFIPYTDGSAQPRAVFLNSTLQMQEVDFKAAPVPANPKIAEPIMRGLWFNGRWAVMGTNSTDTLSIGLDRLIMVDKQTAMGWTLVTSADFKGAQPLAFKYGSVAVRDDGMVLCYVTMADKTFQLWAIQPPLVDPVSVKPSQVFTLTGKNLAGLTLTSSVTGLICTGLICTAPATPGTYIMQGKTTGAGWTLNSNPIAVTVVSDTPPSPVVKAVTPQYAGLTLNPSTQYATGAIVTVWGDNLGPNTTVPSPPRDFRFDYLGCSVTLTDSTGTDRRGALYYVSPGQINVQLPFAPVGIYQLTVRNNGLVSKSVSIQLVSLHPNWVQYMVGTIPYLAVLRLDGSYVTGVSPAQPGEIVTIYLTGLGETTPQIPEGQEGAAPVIASVAITTGGVPVEVLYAGLQGQYYGLYQINLRVPNSVTSVSNFTVTATAPDGTVQTDTLNVEK